MKIRQFDISKLQEYPENYNQHSDSQIDELGKSLDMFSQYKNIVVWNGYIIAGNGLFQAAQRQGLKKIYAVDRSDLTEEQAKALLIADNATSTLSTPDAEQLKVLLDGLSDADIPGVNDDFFASVGMGWDNESEDFNIDDFLSDEDKDKKDPVVKTFTCEHCGKESKIS